VRFGRIPKREKQRLLDEMQSYMNSLNNESASMEVEASAPAAEAPRSPSNGHTAAGSTPQSYHTNAFMSCEEKPLKMAAAANNHHNNNGSASCFGGASQDFSTTAVQPQSQSLAGQFQGVPSGYHLPAHCAANVNKKPNASALPDNAKYTYALSQSGQSQQCPVTGATAASSSSSSSSQPMPANQNVFAASESQKPTSCPWKLSGGAKVLVITCSYSDVHNGDD